MCNHQGNHHTLGHQLSDSPRWYYQHTINTLLTHSLRTSSIQLTTPAKSSSFSTLSSLLKVGVIVFFLSVSSSRKHDHVVGQHSHTADSFKVRSECVLVVLLLDQLSPPPCPPPSPETSSFFSCQRPAAVCAGQVVR